MEYTRFSESPDSFHFWTAVSVIAGALRRRVWIDQRYFQWTPNFYTIFVAPPGVVAKSTSVSIGMRILEHVDGINFGPQAVTWQSLTKSLAEALELVDMNYGTGEESEFHPMSCITCAVSELGTFLQPKEQGLVDALISLWDGQLTVWKKDTKTSGKDVIQNPWINIIGCTTPAWIRQNFTEEMITGGLASRTLFVYEELKRQLIPYPADMWGEVAFNEATMALAHDLAVIANLRGEYTISPEAKTWGAAWYRSLWGVRPPHMASERYSAYISRKQTHIHKVAMVFAAATSDTLVLEQKHLERANAAVTSLETNMQRVFDKVGESHTQKHVSVLLSYLDAYGEMDEGWLWRNCLPMMSGVEFKAALAGALAAGMIKRTAANGKVTIARVKGK